MSDDELRSIEQKARLSTWRSQQRRQQKRRRWWHWHPTREQIGWAFIALLFVAIVVMMVYVLWFDPDYN